MLIFDWVLLISLKKSIGKIDQESIYAADHRTVDLRPLIIMKYQIVEWIIGMNLVLFLRFAVRGIWLPKIHL